LKLAEGSKERAQVPWILSRLGNILIATGPADAAEITLRRALDMARESGDTALTVAALNGPREFPGQPTEGARGRRRLPRERRARGARRRRVPGDALPGSIWPEPCGSPETCGRRGRPSTPRSARWSGSSPSREASFLLVSIGVGYRELRAAGPDPGGELLLRAARALNRAGEIAEQLGDRRTTSYARGYLGALYEDERRYAEALQLTREAIFAAQQAHAPESLYRWQWQVARLHRKMGAVDEAPRAYRAAAPARAAVRPELSGALRRVEQSRIASPSARSTSSSSTCSSAGRGMGRPLRRARPEGPR